MFTGDWWRYYGYLQLYSAHARNGGIQVAWTLCVEVTYYIALPLWAMAIRRLPGAGTVAGFVRSELAALALVVLGGGAVQIAVSRGHLPYVLGVSLVGQGAWIALGMALAVLSVAGQREPQLVDPIRRLADRPAFQRFIQFLFVFTKLVPTISFNPKRVAADPQALEALVERKLQLFMPATRNLF